MENSISSHFHFSLACSIVMLLKKYQLLRIWVYTFRGYIANKSGKGPVNRLYLYHYSCLLNTTERYSSGGPWCSLVSLVCWTMGPVLCIQWSGVREKSKNEKRQSQSSWQQLQERRQAFNKFKRRLVLNCK